jgi:hypothetical protein
MTIIHAMQLYLITRKKKKQKQKHVILPLPPDTYSASMEIVNLKWTYACSKPANKRSMPHIRLSQNRLQSNACSTEENKIPRAEKGKWLYQLNINSSKKGGGSELYKG